MNRPTGKPTSKAVLIANELIPVKYKNYEDGISSPNNLKRIYLTSSEALVEYHIPIPVVNGKKFGLNRLEFDSDNTGTGLEGLVKPLVCSMVEEIIIDTSLFSAEHITIDLIWSELLKGNVQVQNRFPRLRNITVVSGLSIPVLAAYCVKSKDAIGGFDRIIDHAGAIGFKIVTTIYTGRQDWYYGTYYRPLHYSFDEELKTYFNERELEIEKILDQKRLARVNGNNGAENIEAQGNQIVSKYICLGSKQLAAYKPFMDALKEYTQEFTAFIIAKNYQVFPLDLVYSDEQTGNIMKLGKLFKSCEKLGLKPWKLADFPNFSLNGLVEVHEICLQDFKSEQTILMSSDSDEDEDDDEFFDPDEIDGDDEFIDPDELDADSEDSDDFDIADEADELGIEAEEQDEFGDESDYDDGTDIDNDKTTEESPTLGDEAEPTLTVIREYLKVLNDTLGLCDYSFEERLRTELSSLNLSRLVISIYYYNQMSDEMSLNNFKEVNLKNFIQLVGKPSEEVCIRSKVGRQTLEFNIVLLKEVMSILNKQKKYNKLLAKDFVNFLRSRGYREIHGGELIKFTRTFRGNKASRATPDGIQALRPYVAARFLREIEQSGSLIYCNADYDKTENFDNFSFKVFFKENASFDDFYFFLPNNAEDYIKTNNMGAYLINDYQDVFPDNLSPELSVHSAEHENNTPNNVLHVVVTKTEFDTKVIRLEQLASGSDPDLLKLFNGPYRYGDVSNLVLGYTPREIYTLNGNILANRSVLCGGGQGSGKTVLLWDIMLQLVANGWPVVGVDIKGELAGVLNSIGYLGFSDANPLDKDLVYYDPKKDELVNSRTYSPWAIGLDLQMAIYRYYKKKMTSVTAKTLDEYNAKCPDHQLRPIIFVTDEVESLYATKDRESKRSIANIAALSSQTRTSGIWRLYGTQTPTTSTLSQQLLTNITYKVIGKNLNENTISSSLKLGYNKNLYDKVNREDIRGAFVAYDNTKQTLMKSLLSPETEDSIMEFLGRYSGPAYKDSVNFLTNLLVAMQAEGAFKEYPHVEWYLKETGRLGAQTDNVFSSFMGGSEDEYDEFEDAPFEVSETPSYLSKPQDMSVSQIDIQPNPVYSPIGSVANDLYNKEVIKRKLEEPLKVKTELYNQSFPWAKHNGIAGKFMRGSGLMSKMLYKDLTGVVMDQIKSAQGGLENVHSVGFLSGYLVINNRLLELEMSIYEGQIESPIVLDIISKGLWGEIFDFSKLRKFKNLQQVEIEGVNTFYKMKADLGISTMGDLKAKLPRLDTFVVDGRVIDLGSVGITQDERYERMSKKYERVSNYKFNPEKYNLISNFYKKSNIPTKYKVAGTVAALGVVGLIGSFAGPVLLPAILGISVWNKIKRQG